MDTDEELDTDEDLPFIIATEQELEDFLSLVAGHFIKWHRRLLGKDPDPRTAVVLGFAMAAAMAGEPDEEEE